MGDFVTIVSREEHECGPLPGWFGRWANSHKEGSIIKCTTSGCGQYWKLKNDNGKLVWKKTNYQ